MPEVDIDGLLVHFPFEPYDAQINYMKKVVECLRTGSNGVLESPTGTGKTLCLLCSALAWLQTRKAQQSLMRAGASEDDYFLGLKESISSASGLGWSSKMNIPKIIYSSRTHSQLSQVVRELLRTRYKDVKAVVIGSRDQLCLHPEVKAETNSFTKINLCRTKVAAKICPYYNNVEAKIVEFKDSVADIEDLVTKGKKHTMCPYYAARMLKDSADAIFMPYNYLVDPRARRAHNISMEGNIVILDEAHNIGKMCEDSASFELKSRDIAACISEVTQVMKNLHSMGDDPAMDGMPAEDFTLSDLATLKTLLCELEDQIEGIQFPKEKNEVTFPGSYMFELLRKAELTANKKAAVLDLVDKVVQYLSTLSTGPFQSKGKGLQKLADMVRIVFNKDRADDRGLNVATTSYNVHVKTDDDKKQGDVWVVPKITRKAPKVLNYWCFNPGIGMQDIIEQNVHCLLLTSGTLSPLNTFASELKIPFPVTLENPHIIKDEQIWVGVFCVGPDNTRLNSSYRNRENLQYVDSLGNAILNFARIIPDGLLVFFPSYFAMKSCKERWEFKGIWSSISQQKAIFVEPQDKDGFIQSMDQYYERINDPKLSGAIFMAVCRGKASEGLDFADRNGRAVIITGIPYPPFKDARVSLKVQYMTEEKKKNASKGLNGNDWYQLEATRAINQAVGRVIRHKDDYAAIIFCDERFSTEFIKGNLSMWLRPRIKSFKNFGMGLKDVNMFFKKISHQPSVNNPVNNSVCDLSTNAAPLVHFTKALMWPLPEKPIPQVKPEEDVYAAYASTSRTDDKVCDKKISLFEALDEPECSSKFVDFQFGNTPLKKACVPSTVGPPPKRKKLIIMSKEALFETANASVPNVPQSTGNSGTKQNSIVIPSAIRKELDEQRYNAFEAAMKKYSADRDITSFCKTIGSVFDKPELHILFCDIRNLVAEQHRTFYDKHVKKVTGKSPEQDAENVTETKKVAIHQSYKAFIVKIKQSINPEKYNLFSTALKSYGVDHDVNRFAISLISVFDSPDKYSLFYDMRNYVEKSHRSIYDNCVRTVVPSFSSGD